MADYAVAMALRKLKRFLNPSLTKFPVHKQEFMFFFKRLCYFEAFLSDLRSKHRTAISVEEDIELLVDKIEDLLGPLLSQDSCNKSSLVLPPELVQLQHETTHLTVKLSMMQYQTEEDTPPDDFLADDDELQWGRYDYNHPIVGLEDEIQDLKDTVMDGTSKLKQIPIFGMAGIGKTTLAKEVYSNLLPQFDFYFIFILHKNITFRATLEYVMTTLGMHVNDETTWKTLELKFHLGRCLQGKKYLFLFDNVWNWEMMEELLKLFPDHNIGSRIIITSREDVRSKWNDTIHCGHSKYYLKEEDSWKLLHNVIFTAQTSCSNELAEIGKKIAKKCEGLPLAIIAMGELLREGEQTIQRWEEVLQDEDPLLINKNDGRCISKSLYLSYDRLPFHLKSCFLYVGVLPRNYDIYVSCIIELWIAEGLIAPTKDKSIGDTACELIMDLCYASMIEPLCPPFNHELFEKQHRVHFAFRSLCIREAQMQSFCLVIRKYVDMLHKRSYSYPRLCFYNNILLGFKEVQNFIKSVPSTIGSILFCGPHHKYPMRVCLDFISLKVLNALNIHFYEFPLEVLKLSRLRYLAIMYDGKIPSSISKLWKLEFLILGRCHAIKSSKEPKQLPVEIWNLQWLMHLKCTGWDLQSPNCTNNLVLEYISKFSGVSDSSCTPDILARMPNLKKLGVDLELTENDTLNFSFFSDISEHLLQLYSFKCVVAGLNTDFVSSCIPDFPTTISKLTLSGCGFPWKCMSLVSRLPHLKTFKLRHHAFSGPVWEVDGYGFPRLICLIMEDLNIKEWRANSQQFPSLTLLHISHCYHLEGVPIEFAGLKVAFAMVLMSNNASVEKSARQIMQIREQSGRSWSQRNTFVYVSTLDGTVTGCEIKTKDDGLRSTILEPLPRNNYN